jgi:hypothetical protein
VGALTDFGPCCARASDAVKQVQKISLASTNVKEMMGDMLSLIRSEFIPLPLLFLNIKISSMGKVTVVY